jgi:hypothetical protein
MKRFLFHISLCFLVLVVLNLIYSFVVDGNLRTYERKYFAVPDKVELLVLGDSHADGAWAANTDPDRYTFAYGSDNITDMRLKFEYVAANNHAGGRKVVVLPFDPQLISIYRESKHNNRMNRLINSPYLPMQVSYALPLFFDRNTELDVKLFLLRKAKTPDPGDNRDFTKAQARSRLKDQYPEPKASNLLLTEYQALIDAARDKNYSIIAVRYPVHPYYDSLINSFPNSINLKNKMDSLAMTNDLKLNDFSGAITDERYFRDQDHLNKEGSAAWIKRFNLLYPQ